MEQDTRDPPIDEIREVLGEDPRYRDIDTAIEALADEEGIQEVEWGEYYLLQYPYSAHPRLMKLVEARKGPWENAAYVLARIGWPESVPVIAEAFTETASPELSNALAFHPDPSAAAVLEAAARSDRDDLAFQAARGLVNRKAHSSCEVLRGRVDDPDPARRRVFGVSALELGCLSEEEVEKLRNDPDRSVRDMINETLESKRQRSGSP